MGFAAVTRSASQGSCISIPSGASPSQPAAGFANLTLLAISFHHHPAPKLGSPCSCGGSRCCPAPQPRGGNCWQQGWGEAAGQPEARVAFLGGTKEGSVCTQQPGQMLGTGAAIQGKSRRSSHSALTLPWPRW